MMQTVSFSWPWIFLLLPLPLLWRLFPAKQATDAIAVPTRLAKALDSVQAKPLNQPLLQHIIPWVCWVLLLLAIAQPSITGNALSRTADGRAMAIAIDLSGSMERKDFILDELASDRLSVVKAVAGQFIEAQKGNRLALVLFAEEAFVASPLSFDTRAVASYLHSAGIGMAGRSTAIGDALGLAIQTLRSDPASNKAIVLLSDGTNNSGTVEPESAAELAAELSINIHTIALASDALASGYATSPSADLDEQTLQRIAEKSGGKFFRARTTQELQAIYTRIEQLATAEAKTPDILLQHDIRNPILLMLFVVLLLWEAPRWAGARP